MSSFGNPMLIRKLMYINKPSVTKVEAADRVNLFHSTSASLNSTNVESLVNCLYPCPDIPYFMIITKKTLAFKHRI